MKRFPWDHLHAFLAIIRAGNLREASNTIKVSTATLSRRLDLLEQRLGGKLVERTSTGCIPTDLGLRVATWAEQMENAAYGVLREIEKPSELSGTLQINADEWTSFLLIGLLPKLNRLHPNLNFDVLTSQQPYNLTRREADVVIRFSTPETADLKAIRLGHMTYGLYCNEQYLEANRCAIEQQQWEKLDFIGLDEPRSDFEVEAWLRSLSGSPRPWLRCNYAVGVLDAVLAGGGLGIIENSVAKQISDNLFLVKQATQLSKQVWAWVHRSLYDSPRHQALINYLERTWDQTLVQD